MMGNPCQIMRWIAVVAALSTGISAADEEWQAGLASVKITPEAPVRLSGYASRNKPFEKVAADLWAKALALEDGKGARALLVTFDLIGLPASVADPLCRQITEKTGIPRPRILLNFSHTHTGPTPSLKTEPYGNLSADEAKRQAAYTRAMMAKVVDLAGQAVASMSPARLSWGQGVSHIAMNRREFTPRGVRLGVNPRGLVDRSVPVLRLDDAKGKLRGVVFGYACHGTTLGGRDYVVCGDYMGYAQERLERELEGVTTLFVSGCGGDANPYPRGRIEYAQDNGANLAREVIRVLKTDLAAVEGPLGIGFERVDLPFRKVEREELAAIASRGPGYQRGVARKQLEAIDKGEAPASHYVAPITVWQFGESLTLVGLPGEVVVDFMTMTERAVGPLRLWVAGYCNDVFGYLVSAQVLEEGGYETRGTYHGAAGFFSRDAEKVVVKKVVELARKAGRKIPRPEEPARR